MFENFLNSKNWRPDKWDIGHPQVIIDCTSKQPKVEKEERKPLKKEYYIEFVPYQEMYRVYDPEHPEHTVAWYDYPDEAREEHPEYSYYEV